MRCPFCEEYDITEEQYDEMLEMRDETCPCCCEYTIPEEDDDE